MNSDKNMTDPRSGRKRIHISLLNELLSSRMRTSIKWQSTLNTYIETFTKHFQFGVNFIAWTKLDLQILLPRKCCYIDAGDLSSHTYVKVR